MSALERHLKLAEQRHRAAIDFILNMLAELGSCPVSDIEDLGLDAELAELKRAGSVRIIGSVMGTTTIHYARLAA